MGSNHYDTGCTSWYSSIFHIWTSDQTRGGGYSHIYILRLRHTEVCCFFIWNPWTRVPLSTKISLNMGLFLQNFQIFLGLPNGAIFSEKSLKMGTLLPKWPLKMGMGFMTRVAHLHPNQIWVPSPPSWRTRLHTYLGEQ